MRKIGAPRQTSTVWPAAATPSRTRHVAAPTRRSGVEPASMANATPPRLARNATHSTAVGPSDQSDDADEQHAAERGAGEIGGVEPAHARGKSGQRQADRDAADHERHGDHDVGEAQSRRSRRPTARCGTGCSARSGSSAPWRSETRRAASASRCRKRSGGKKPRREVDDQRAGGHAEHRHRQRDECEVVQHRHAEDAGQQDLVHQRRQGDEEDPDVGGGVGLRTRQTMVWIQTRHHTM